MTVLYVSENERTVEALAQTAQRLNWQMASANRGSLAIELTRLQPDLLLIDTRNDDDPEWWRGVAAVECKNIICVHHDRGSEWMTRAFNAGADALLPASHLSPGIV